MTELKIPPGLHEQTRRIEELTSLLGQYRKINELMALTHGKIISQQFLNPCCVFLSKTQIFSPLFIHFSTNLGSSEEELSGSVKVRAITQKAHCDIYRSEVRSHSGPYNLKKKIQRFVLLCISSQMSFFFTFQQNGTIFQGDHLI